MSITAGIDVGSTYTKAVLLDECGRILGRSMTRTGFRLPEVARRTFEEALALTGVAEGDVRYIVTTGYGRFQVPFRDVQVTDLTAAARGSAWFFPATRTVLDVGGQTMKASRLDERCVVKSFRLNDKCAAGTGRFFEVSAARERAADVHRVEGAAARGEVERLLGTAVLHEPLTVQKVEIAGVGVYGGMRCVRRVRGICRVCRVCGRRRVAGDTRRLGPSSGRARRRLDRLLARGGVRWRRQGRENAWVHRSTPCSSNGPPERSPRKGGNAVTVSAK